MKNKMLLTATLAIASASVASVANAEHHEANPEGKEKCYGVAKAGKNDCASKDGSHSCAGLAQHDSDANEWVLLPTGACEKLAGGVKG